MGGVSVRHLGHIAVLTHALSRALLALTQSIGSVAEIERLPVAQLWVWRVWETLLFYDNSGSSSPSYHSSSKHSVTPLNLASLSSPR